MRRIAWERLAARLAALLGGIAAAGCALPSYEEAWSRQLGGIKVDESRAIAVDSDDNVIIAGRYESYMSFDSDESFVGPDTFGNLFVAKYDCAGDPLWNKSFGDAAPQGAFSVAVDSDDNVFIAGDFMGSMAFGDRTLTNPNPLPPGFPADMTMKPVTHAFVAKLDEDGDPVWAHGFGDPTGMAVTASTGVAADSDGNVVVIGSFGGVVDFGGGGLDSKGVQAVFVAKYDADGDHVFSQSFNDTESVNGRSVATDADDNILVTGDHRGVLTIGSEPTGDAGDADLFVAKIDGSGSPVLWVRSLGNGYPVRGHAIAVDADRNVFVTGEAAGIPDFGGGGLMSVNSSIDLFVLKLNPAGIHQWSRDLGGPGVDLGLAIAVDPAGDALVTGTSDGVLDFDGTPLMAAGIAPATDIFVVKLAGSDGQPRSPSRFGDAMNQEVTGIAVGAEGDVFLTGIFVGSLDFGGTPLTSNSAEKDSFVARLVPLP